MSVIVVVLFTVIAFGPFALIPSLRVLGLKSTIALILLALHIASAIYYWLDLVNRSISASMS